MLGCSTTTASTNDSSENGDSLSCQENARSTKYDDTRSPSNRLGTCTLPTVTSSSADSASLSLPTSSSDSSSPKSSVPTELSGSW